MIEKDQQTPSFNLWTEPWISLERQDGRLEKFSIEQTLLQAHTVKFIYEPSPLVIVSIHRLLVAILQAAIAPKSIGDLHKLWDANRFSESAIHDLGRQYSERFDLFSFDAPFLQSADLPSQPDKNSKPVVYLTPEIPAGTAVTHYHHGSEETHTFCPGCAASGLVCIPAFATSGGAGIKPSINGVPPLYVLPGGLSLFESLAASLLRPAYQPAMASKEDFPWWRREPIVMKSSEVHQVGYLQSLTFPARRVRLQPEMLNAICTRCGERSTWGVRTMVFEMGESRPKDAEPWMDPFAAYKVTEDTGKLTPIRPTQGKATWREFAGLFLRPSLTKKPDTGQAYRPSVLNQIVDFGLNRDTFSFRCIGMRTDMKAKVFEWVDTSFEVPPKLLRDENAGWCVQEVIQFAADCAAIISRTYRQSFGGEAKKTERYKKLRTRMVDVYWSALAVPFRRFVLDIANSQQQETARRQWAETVIREAEKAFSQTADTIGDNAATLRQRVIGERNCHFRVDKKRKEFLNV